MFRSSIRCTEGCVANAATSTRSATAIGSVAATKARPAGESARGEAHSASSAANGITPR